jgi:hypothetical protein
MSVVSGAITFASGIASAYLTEVLWEQRRRVRRVFNRWRTARPDVLDFDPLSVGLYPINRWSPARPLVRHRLRMHVTTARPSSHWVDDVEWRACLNDLRRIHSGRIAYMTGFSIDHRESDHGEFFHYWVTPCDYSEHLATVWFLGGHPDVREKIRNMLEKGQVSEFLRHSPPSLIKINVSLVSDDDKVLAVQRSGAVQEKKGQWTLGPNETMSLDSAAVPGTPPEDLFGMAERCLREEVDLEPSDYGPVSISWIGCEAATASVKVYAQVRCRLPAREIIDRLFRAHSVYEMQDMAWIPFTRRALTYVVGAAGHGGDRAWSSSAPLAAQELWRMHSSLTAEDR